MSKDENQEYFEEVMTDLRDQVRGVKWKIDAIYYDLAAEYNKLVDIIDFIEEICPAITELKVEMKVGRMRKRDIDFAKLKGPTASEKLLRDILKELD